MCDAKKKLFFFYHAEQSNPFSYTRLYIVFLGMCNVENDKYSPLYYV